MRKTLCNFKSNTNDLWLKNMPRKMILHMYVHARVHVCVYIKETKN